MICTKAAEEIEKLRAEINEQARLLGISAEKELALRAENERLKAELKSIDGALCDPRANLTLTTAEIIREIKTELAEKEAEILKLNQMYPATAYTLEVEKQLAAALAACEAKDAALESLISHTLSCEQRLDEFHGLGNDSGSGCSIELCNASAALAIKPDASALRQHDEALIERCAVVCEEYIDRIEAKRDEKYQAEYAGRQAGATRCAAAIRELKERH